MADSRRANSAQIRQSRPDSGLGLRYLPGKSPSKPSKFFPFRSAAPKLRALAMRIDPPTQLGRAPVPAEPRKVDIRLPGKGDSNSHGARPVHQKRRWTRTSRLSIKNSLSLQAERGYRVPSAGTGAFTRKNVPPQPRSLGPP